MFGTGVRFMSSRASPRPTKVLLDLLQEHGPKTVNDFWKIAQPAGIKSKTHMKLLLHWLVEKQRVQKVCHHLKDKGGPQGAKEFLFSNALKVKKEAETSVTVQGDSMPLGKVAIEGAENQIGSTT